MAAVAKTVEKIVAPTAQGLGIEIWDTEYKKEGGTYVLRIYIDKKEGITIEDCENFSRAIDPILDETDPVPDSYVLEVSSAGLDRMLTKAEHFEKYIGTSVDVTLYKAEDGKKTVTGILVSRDDEKLTVSEDNKEIIFDNKNVASVRLTVIF